MNSIIPGHVRAFTWMLLIVSIAVALNFKGLLAALGVSIVILGAFLGDQATHLAQMEHSAPAPTLIERKMQEYKYTFQSISLLLVGFGFGFLILLS